MKDKKVLKEMERALAEDWRTVKQLIEDYNEKTGEEVMDELGDLNSDIINRNTK